jgi:HPt (histidine-containing phosphotransfer) domain-containing protein
MVERKESFSPSQAPLFNANVLEDFYGGADYPGAAQIFIDCANLMLENLEPRLQNLEQSIQAQNYDKVIYYAHQLRGSFGATGSALLADLCAQLETDAQQNNEAVLMDQLNSMSPLVREFRHLLTQFLNKIAKH